MTSLVEQNRAFAVNKLKHDLKPWRNLLVQLDSILMWEKPYYPAALVGAITLFHLILWELNLSTITLLALAGLTLLAFNMVYPLVARLLYKPINWTDTQEASFEQICQQICSIKIAVQCCKDFWFANQQRKSTSKLILAIISLLLLAWVGAAFNNMLLMYCIILTAALLPGIKHVSVMENIPKIIYSLLKAQVQKMRQRLGNFQAK